MSNARKVTAILSTAACVTLLSACGGSSSGSSDGAEQVKTGVFVDSPVENIAYETDSQSGRTNEDGEFSYKDEETVTFSIGDVELPAVAAGEFISPLTLAGTLDPSDTRAVNIARLLQTIDSDGDSDNGITIDDTAHAAATGLAPVDFASASFDEDVDDLVQNSGSPTKSLVSEEVAMAHMESQSRTLELVVEDMDGIFYNEGTRTLVIGTDYTVADVSGKTYTFNPFGQGELPVYFNSDGSGTITFGPEDTNPLIWEVVDGKVYYTETDDYGDSWDVVITPIAVTSTGENVLVEISSPDGQEDFANGAGLGTFEESVTDDGTISPGMEITVDLSVENSGGIFYNEGTQTLVIGSLYSEADVSGKTFSFMPFSEGPWSVSFNSGGTGSITFAPGDTNPLSWHVDGGKIYYTETDAYGDSWDVVITPIEVTSGGENVLVEISSPVGQEDFANGAGLGVLFESP